MGRYEVGLLSRNRILEGDRIPRRSVGNRTIVDDTHMGRIRNIIDLHFRGAKIGHLDLCPARSLDGEGIRSTTRYEKL